MCLNYHTPLALPTHSHAVAIPPCVAVRLLYGAVLQKKLFAYCFTAEKYLLYQIIINLFLKCNKIFNFYRENKCIY